MSQFSDHRQARRRRTKWVNGPLIVGARRGRVPPTAGLAVRHPRARQVRRLAVANAHLRPPPEAPLPRRLPGVPHQGPVRGVPRGLRSAVRAQPVVRGDRHCGAVRHDLRHVASADGGSGSGGGGVYVPVAGGGDGGERRVLGAGDGRDGRLGLQGDPRRRVQVRRGVFRGEGPGGGLRQLRHGALPPRRLPRHGRSFIRDSVHVPPREALGKSTFELAVQLMKWLPLRLVDRVLLLAVPWMKLGDVQKLGLNRLTLGPFELKCVQGKTSVLDLGALHKIKTGKIKVIPRIKKFLRGKVELDDEQILKLDSVSHLCDRLATVATGLALGQGYQGSRPGPKIL